MNKIKFRITKHWFCLSKYHWFRFNSVKQNWEYEFCDIEFRIKTLDRKTIILATNMYNAHTQFERHLNKNEST